ARLGDESISLSPKAFAVFVYLAERSGQLVTKRELLDAVWPDVHVTEGVLKRAVREIRKALADPVEQPRFIQTLHRRGYRFLVSVVLEPASPVSAPDQSGVVGRERELLQLDGWLNEALAGSRQIVFVADGAGLGKTTFIDRFARRRWPQWRRSRSKYLSCWSSKICTGTIPPPSTCSRRSRHAFTGASS